MLTRLVSFIALAAASHVAAAATTDGVSAHIWYVDCARGNDAADGLTPSTAWRSTAAVSVHSFHPGDHILFRRGATCEGMLSPRGSGSAKAPIVIDAWDNGPLPVIHAAPGQEAALKLVDQQYWTIQHLEFSGGQPHGVFITGTEGVLHGIHVRDVVVHDVTGEPKNKEGGLLVISPSSPRQRFDDVTVDGAIAYRTSQWAGILIGGDSRGFLPESARNTNVVVRNSVVHDVAGDGIVLFQVKNGTIENSAAWHTGMQETQTIGTPNAIWTWMCRDCVVRRNEAFLTDSPGVDAGAFDIDYGDDDNTVEENYAHDTQGYCVAVFGAGYVTTNSIVRNNVCANNGRSPRLALRQGAIFLDTWNNGKLRGVSITGNRIFWDPPIRAPFLINIASFDGAGEFEHNQVRSSAPWFIDSNASLKFDDNEYENGGNGDGTEWQYDGRRYRSYEAYRRGAGQDTHSPFVVVDRGALRGQCGLEVTLSANPASRAAIALLIAIRHQFPRLPIDIIATDAGVRDWNFDGIPVRVDPSAHAPSVALVNSLGTRFDAIPPPGDLGLALHSYLGNPDYSRLGSE